MLKIKKKEDVMIITLVVVLIVTLITCIMNKEFIDITYFFVMFYYFIKIMKIRLSDDNEVYEDIEL